MHSNDRISRPSGFSRLSNTTSLHTELLYYAMRGLYENSRGRSEKWIIITYEMRIEKWKVSNSSGGKKNVIFYFNFIYEEILAF